MSCFLHKMKPRNQRFGHKGQVFHCCITEHCGGWGWGGIYGGGEAKVSSSLDHLELQYCFAPFLHAAKAKNVKFNAVFTLLYRSKTAGWALTCIKQLPDTDRPIAPTIRPCRTREAGDVGKIPLQSGFLFLLFCLIHILFHFTLEIFVCDF